MTKNFFIVIPYTPAVLQSKQNFVDKLPLKKENPEAHAKQKMELFEENRTQIEQRVGVVEQGLIRCGVRSVLLGTEEIVELFYKLFNPGDTEKPIQMNS